MYWSTEAYFKFIFHLNKMYFTLKLAVPIYEICQFVEL